ncbi:MAG: hypothetical protein D6B25_04745 [Desulfobulbaceae bacterium]|nr:MAG: hypothetical protein D6B25_04745 [Desulfobulbaceae bacterium]
MMEADRLTTCVFCDIKNYRVDGGLQRFMLPDKIPTRIERSEVIYFPYLRFKGNIYSCRGRTIDYKVLDTTHQGLKVQDIPPSLGLRPQAMTIQMVNGSHSGRFLRRKEPAVTILQRASLLAESFSDYGNDTLFHRAFIGETVSCIYLPLYRDGNSLYDGVLNRRISSFEPWYTQENGSVRYSKEWEPTFLATVCPKCGAAMEGGSDALVLHCYNCHTCCAEKNGKFVPVPFEMVQAQNPNSVYIPFWRISAQSGKSKLRSLADLLRLTNQPVVVNKHHEKQELTFWIPAIKIRPQIFLKVAKSATLTQLKFLKGEQRLAKPIQPVTMPLKEATQALKSVVAETSVNKKEVLEQLPDINFSIKRNTLIFLPFEDTGHDFVQEESSLSIASSVVEFGRKL